MVMRLVDAEAVGAALVEALGLDRAQHALASDEVLACAIRRAAAMSCPCGSLRPRGAASV
jgi:hypothetical protein